MGLVVKTNVCVLPSRSVLVLNWSSPPSLALRLFHHFHSPMTVTDSVTVSTWAPPHRELIISSKPLAIQAPLPTQAAKATMISIVPMTALATVRIVVGS